MIYTGVDYHKRYSVACTLDAQGRKLKEARIEANAPEAFKDYFASLGEASEVIIEACWNWATLHDMLEETAGVGKVVVSHPAKNRIIAEAQIKNDSIDAKALATLLRGDFMSRIHVPSRDVRNRKLMVRQRLWLAAMRTRLRNRIHTVVDRHPQMPRPVVQDIFCKKGIAWLKRVGLPGGDRALLDQDLELHESIQTHIRALEERIDSDNANNPMAQRLLTIPGIGRVLAPVLALEIDKIERFRTADKLCAYAGLVPTTHASGGKIAHGRMLPFCNRWLKWAFVEAAWVAVGCSDYFGTFYKQHRRRGKGANEAIVITARRMAKIAWQLLTQQRDFAANPPRAPQSRKPTSPAALVKD